MLQYSPHGQAAPNHRPVIFRIRCPQRLSAEGKLISVYRILHSRTRRTESLLEGKRAGLTSDGIGSLAGTGS